MTKATPRRRGLFGLQLQKEKSPSPLGLEAWWLEKQTESSHLKLQVQNRELITNGSRLWNPQWHTYSSKATPPKAYPNGTSNHLEYSTSKSIQTSEPKGTFSVKPLHYSCCAHRCHIRHVNGCQRCLFPPLTLQVLGIELKQFNGSKHFDSLGHFTSPLCFFIFCNVI